jgi:hypothetical protein
VVALSLAELCGELGHCDPDVLQHHARGRDFSRWIRDVYRDRELGGTVAEAERALAEGTDDGDGRRALLLALERRGRPPADVADRR